MKAKPILFICIGLVLAALAAAAGVFLLREPEKPARKEDRPTETTGAAETVPEEFIVPARDAEEYFQENSEVIRVTRAKASDDVLSGSKTLEELENRGFTNYALTSTYSMDGTYHDPVIITPDSKEKHPIYETIHQTESGELWSILVINGKFMANPLSYNLQSGRSVQIILSESETVTSYDGTTSTFYETIPDSGTMIIITVDRIDAQTLEEYTTGVIDSYE